MPNTFRELRPGLKVILLFNTESGEGQLNDLYYKVNEK